MPCYCDSLVNPSDLLLQAKVGGPYDYVSSALTVDIQVYSPDGQTLYGDATSYFNWVLISSPTNNKYVNIQLGNDFSPAMYAHGSWILKVTISGTFAGSGMLYFSAYTETFCSPCCPIIPSNITITDTTS